MTLTQIVLLSFIQGLTEFLPISSSAHLILLSHWLGHVDQGIAFDVTVHLGTLVAVIAYFFKDLVALAKAGWYSLLGRGLSAQAKLFWAVVLATIPVGIFGFLGKDFISLYLRSPWVIAVTTLLFALLLWWADSTAKATRSEQNIKAKDILWVGFAQSLALIPGVSRSGITMTAGLMTGLTKKASARFSFLLAIPVIFLANFLAFYHLAYEPFHRQVKVTSLDLLLGFSIAGVTALLCIHTFLKCIERLGFLPFIIYRLALGVALLFMIS